MNPSKRVTMTLRDAMSMALENNRDIEVERLNVQMNGFDLQAAQGVYDPALCCDVILRSPFDSSDFDLRR